MKRQLVKHLKFAKEKGYATKLIYNKLRLNGKLYTLQDLQQSNNIQETSEEKTPTHKSKGSKYSERTPEEEKKEIKRAVRTNT